MIENGERVEGHEGFGRVGRVHLALSMKIS